VKPIKREYKVAHTKGDHGKGDITGYFITDAHDNDELDERPVLMSFPVSVLYPRRDQEQRAEEYAEYMNKIIRATMQAYENNNLMEVLKGENNG
jgi:hypothetical protein